MGGACGFQTDNQYVGAASLPEMLMSSLLSQGLKCSTCIQRLSPFYLLINKLWVEHTASECWLLFGRCHISHICEVLLSISGAVHIHRLCKMHYSNFMSQINRRLLSLYMMIKKLIALIERGQQFYYQIPFCILVFFKKANCCSSGHAFAWSTICHSRKTVTDTSLHRTQCERQRETWKIALCS